MLLNRREYRRGLMARAAVLYYHEKLTQHEIAKRLAVSRQAVGRLLAAAEESGIVLVTINVPDIRRIELENQLVKHYGLRNAVVVDAPQDDPGLLKQTVARAAADYLDRVVRDGDVVAISWGTTVYECVRALPTRQHHDVTLVQFNGDSSDPTLPCSPMDVFREAIRAWNARYVLFRVPAFLETADLWASLKRQTSVQSVFEHFERARVAVFSIGGLVDDEIIPRARAIEPEVIESVVARGGVTELAAHYLNAEGELVDPELEARTAGPPIKGLRCKEVSIVVAGGMHKARAVRAVLRGGYCNVLITDQSVATYLLRGGVAIS